MRLFLINLTPYGESLDQKCHFSVAEPVDSLRAESTGNQWLSPCPSWVNKLSFERGRPGSNGDSKI